MPALLFGYEPFCGAQSRISRPRRKRGAGQRFVLIHGLAGMAQIHLGQPLFATTANSPASG
ncbi:MAG: hypothetical protein IPL28_07840 [Chloroflexi bacterium]|nr:hypothetical protein [Chloroflexota bacterium]